jgi:hypothetical protein
VGFFGLFGYKHELPNVMEKICFYGLLDEFGLFFL